MEEILRWDRRVRVLTFADRESALRALRALREAGLPVLPAEGGRPEVILEVEDRHLGLVEELRTARASEGITLAPAIHAVGG